MLTPRKLLHLLILFSFSILLIHFSYHSSSFHLAHSPSSASNLLKNPNPKTNFTFIIKLLAYDRLDSLSRCLNSLAAADYSGDSVHLHIFIDHFSDDDRAGSSVSFDERLNHSHRILAFADEFSWRFGEKLVHYRTRNVGLQAQWLEAWWPSSDHEFAFVVEDDLEVSPLYYTFLKRLILNYYYNSSNFSPFVYGASLQRPRFVPGKHGKKLHVDSGTRLFLYQLVGTWGQLLFPKPWKEFRLWYDTHKTKNIKPILEGMVTTGWYKRMGERIWTPWFIKFIHSRGYFNLYTNFLQERALSVSHRDAGVNYGKTAGPDSHLLDEKSLDFNLLEMQSLRNLKWYDFCFREVIPRGVTGNYDELGHVLDMVQKHKTVILVSLFRTYETITKNMLCCFERLDINNYLLIGSSADLLLDLARRGHPVIDSEKLLNSIKYQNLKRFGGFKEQLIKETLAKAYVMKSCISLGLSCWITSANMLPIDGNTFFNSGDVSSDFSMAKNLELLFVRSSSTTTKIWVDEFIDRVAETANSLVGGKDSVSSEKMNFSYFIMKSLELKGISSEKVNELSFSVKIDTSFSNETSVKKEGKKIVFWSSETSLDFVQKRLGDLDLWVVDGESSCTAVVCHQS